MRQAFTTTAIIGLSSLACPISSAEELPASSGKTCDVFCQFLASLQTPQARKPENVEDTRVIERWRPKIHGRHAFIRHREIRFTFENTATKAPRIPERHAFFAVKPRIAVVAASAAPDRDAKSTVAESKNSAMLRDVLKPVLFRALDNSDEASARHALAEAFFAKSRAATLGSRAPTSAPSAYVSPTVRSPAIVASPSDHETSGTGGDLKSKSEIASIVAPTSPTSPPMPSIGKPMDPPSSSSGTYALTNPSSPTFAISNLFHAFANQTRSTVFVLAMSGLIGIAGLSGTTLAWRKRKFNVHKSNLLIDQPASSTPPRNSRTTPIRKKFGIDPRNLAIQRDGARSRRERPGVVVSTFPSRGLWD